MVDPEVALVRLREAARAGEIDDLCARHHVRLLVAFGSAAHPTSRPAEDLDIAVAFEPGVGGDAVALIDALATVAGTGLLFETGRENSPGLRWPPCSTHGHRLASAPRPRSDGPVTPPDLDPDVVHARLRLMRDRRIGRGHDACEA